MPSTTNCPAERMALLRCGSPLNRMGRWPFPAEVITVAVRRYLRLGLTNGSTDIGASAPLRIVLKENVGHYNAGHSHQGDAMGLRAPDDQA